SVLLDRSAKKPLVMFSLEGGVDIEEVAEKTPELLIKRNVDPLVGLTKDEALEIVRAAGTPEDVQGGVADILVALYKVWIEEDATLAEINPLIITPERKAKALDAKVSLDESALFRHKENAELRYTQGEDEQEKTAREKGITYVALDGDIGILGNG